MKVLMRTFLVALAATLGLVACEDEAVETTERWTNKSLPSNMPVPLPWFTDEQVVSGARLYQTNCAECHGKKAEGEEDWQGIGPDGKRPPPPLNGSAHASHHSVNDLRAVFMADDHGAQDGEQSRKAKLTDQHALAIIAWMQSLWPDEVYSKWHYRHHRNQWH